MTQDRTRKETKAKAQQPKPVLNSDPMQEVEVPESTLDMSPENVLRLQRTIGNSATARLLQKKTSIPAPLEAEDEIRQRAEAAAGYDLSQTTIEPNSPLATSSGVEALTVGDTIHFANGTYDPETPHGAHVLAHEYGHVVQQGSGQTIDIDDPGQYDEMETRAEAFSQRVDQSLSGVLGLTRSLTRPAQPAAQAFDPRYHRESVVHGLADSSFSNEEIGKIYAANWERDLSQAHPALGAVILAWKECKVAAATGKLEQTNIDKFKGTVYSLVDQASSIKGIQALMNDTAYGGYAFYEHMDNPGNLDIRSKMMQLGGWTLLPAAPPGIPPYIVVSREYIKSELFHAAESYRNDKMGNGGVGFETAANFGAIAKKLEGVDGRTEVNPKGASTKPAGDEAAIQAGQVRGNNPPAAGPSTGAQGKFDNPGVADHLGRASHALEDFFAHSNFVDTALDAANGKIDPSKPQEIYTGTFGSNDKIHALAHKVRAIADEIETETPLVNRVAGKTNENPDPSQVHVGSEAEPTEEKNMDGLPWDLPMKFGKKFFEPAAKAGDEGAQRGEQTGQAVGKEAGRFEGTLLGGVLGGLSGSVAGRAIGGAVGGVVGRVGGFIGGLIGMDKSAAAKAAFNEVVLGPDGVRGLRQVAELMEDYSRHEAKENEKEDPTAHSHTTLAKDQAGHDEHGTEKTLKFEMALECSKEADHMILGKMREVMDAQNPWQADANLKAIYTTLDALIAPPSKSHPLSAILQSKIDAAAKAKAEEPQPQP